MRPTWYADPCMKYRTRLQGEGVNPDFEPRLQRKVGSLNQVSKLFYGAGLPRARQIRHVNPPHRTAFETNWMLTALVSVAAQAKVCKSGSPQGFRWLPQPAERAEGFTKRRCRQPTRRVAPQVTKACHGHLAVTTFEVISQRACTIPADFWKPCAPNKNTHWLFKKQEPQSARLSRT